MPLAAEGRVMGRLGQRAVRDRNRYASTAVPNGQQGGHSALSSPAGPYGGSQDAWALWLDRSRSPTEGGSMQKETPVTLVRHDPEMALSAAPGRSALIVFLTFAKRA